MDGLCFRGCVQHGFSSQISMSGGIEGRRQPVHVSSVNGGSGNGPNGDLLRLSFVDHVKRPVWPNGVKGNRENRASFDFDEGLVRNGELDEEAELLGSEEGRGSWVLKILQVRSMWREKREVDDHGGLEKIDEEESSSSSSSSSCGECEGCGVGGDEEEEEFDRGSFARFLRRVSLAEAVFYGRMSSLAQLAYFIPKIKPENLLKHHRLRFVTSSIERKKAHSINAEKDETPTQALEMEDKPNEQVKEDKDQITKDTNRISASAAYHIAAIAASYLQNRTRDILPFRSPKPIGEELEEGCSRANESAEIANSEPASFVETTNSLTAVVAAEEEVKQAVAQDLNSVHLSPCEWFICDDEKNRTRIFVIQGSESVASWQANLLFEPVHFEGLDVLVHRGIYEAAKGIYEQLLPEVQSHLQAHDSATVRFIGHSLGGSLALLVNLMLLVRQKVSLASLLPVITFGSPNTMCGGDLLLRRLGLSQNHVQAIVMHRDIVPRAFSCNYPDRVAELLKAVNSNFRNHPCLNNQKMLYAPMGEILILQPDEKVAPCHDLLPSGVGFYRLIRPLPEYGDPDNQLRAAQTAFLNSPHPLEILRNRSAYGSGGSICRDHDMKWYLKAVRSAIRSELHRIRKENEHRRQVWWPLILSQNIHIDINMSRWMSSGNFTPNQAKLSSVFRTGKESLKRFSRLIASQNTHLLIVSLVPCTTFFSSNPHNHQFPLN
ncbi:hypothetical protein Scep_030784 [Stephania cephalantha]|uniref:Fungal lipase-type domain-containing protein n=1 Tax=Stephania cephalantha TaxID=152367 RepID=A0AAP0HDG4_9MAGN